MRVQRMMVRLVAPGLLFGAACAGPSATTPVATAPAANTPVANPEGARSWPSALASTGAPDAGARVAGTWIWRCCGERWRGVLVLTQEQNTVRGAFVNDESGTGQLIDGSMEGGTLRFVRAWTDQGAPRRQEYTLALTRGEQALEGTFIERHAPGPAIDFRAERGFVGIERPFHGTEAAPCPPASGQIIGQESDLRRPPER